MTMSRRGVLASCLAVFAAPALLSAHHSISAVYDARQSVTIEVTLLEFHFVNPHPYLIAEERSANGAATRWHMEMDNLGELADVGVTARTFQVGDRVTVTGDRGRSEPHSLYVKRLLRAADGLLYEQVGFSPRLTRPR